MLLVVPWTAIHVILQSQWWFSHEAKVAITTLGISAIFGLIVWRMRAGTLAAAATGAAITASLMYSMSGSVYRYRWLHSGLVPLVAVFLLTYAATKAGRTRKEKQGTAEIKRGRNAAQVAANLGTAAVLPLLGSVYGHELEVVLALAALSEAAADTVSSEIGQAYGGVPRMVTTMRRVEPGTDGAVTLMGTVAGILAATVVAGLGIFSIYGGIYCRVGISGCDVLNPRRIDLLAATFVVTTGGVFGLIFDSLLGASLERKGWLNNDAVNFLSTLAAPAFALALAALINSLAGN